MGVAAKVAAEKVAVKAVKAEKAVVVKAVVAMDLFSHRLSTTLSSPRIKPLCHCCSSCRRPPCGSEKKIAQSSLPRGDGAAALFHRPDHSPPSTVQVQPIVTTRIFSTGVASSAKLPRRSG